MLRLDNVHAFYGPVQVLFSIDLEVHDGEIVALLGTNGAGKTTILRVISGVKEAAIGDVLWNDESIKGLRPPQVLGRGIVQMPGGRGVFPGMSVQENLELAERRRQVAGSLSGGQQQMLTLAKSFIVEPKLLLIDELSLGLAPKIVEELLEIITRMNREGIAVILVDQHVDLALSIANRAYFLERGEIRFSGPAKKLRGRDDLLRSVFLAGARA
jgi:ABC-type branched-subunit amino acid transport system ATPase component